MKEKSNIWAGMVRTTSQNDIDPAQMSSGFLGCHSQHPRPNVQYQQNTWGSRHSGEQVDLEVPDEGFCLRNINDEASKGNGEEGHLESAQSFTNAIKMKPHEKN